MKVFRSRTMSVWMCLALLLETSGAWKNVQAAPTTAPVNLSTTIPLTTPVVIRTSCDGKKKSAVEGVQTGNPMLDAGAAILGSAASKESSVADSLESDDDEDDENKKNACSLPKKMDLTFSCEKQFPGVGLPKELESDPDKYCAQTKVSTIEEVIRGKKVSREVKRISTSEVEANTLAFCYATCVDLKVKIVKEEKACLDQTQADLEANLKQMSEQLGQYSQQVEGQLAEFDGELKERKSMIDAANVMLNGEPGKMGLVQAQAKLQALSASLPAMAKNVKQAAEGLKKDQESFKLYQKQLATNRAVACFKNEPSSNAKMTCDGKVVSPYRYIECVLNKKYATSKGNMGVLDAKKRELAALFAEIESASTPPAPPASGQAAPSAGSARKLSSPAEIRNAYSGKLAALGKDVGLDIGSIVGQQLESCYTRKYTEVQSDVQRTGTDLNRISTNLTNLGSNFSLQGGGEGGKGSQAVSTLLTGIANDYRESLSAAGFAVNVDTAGCLQGTPEVQANCVQALSNAVQSTLTGSLTETSREKLGAAAWALTGNMLPRTGFDQPLKPSSDKYAFLASPVHCEGINNCVTVVRDKVKSLNSSYTTRVQEKKSSIEKINLGLKKQSEDVGKSVKAASAALKTRMNELRNQMAAAGFVVKSSKGSKSRREGLKPQKRTDHEGRSEDSLYDGESLAQHALDSAGMPDVMDELESIQTALAGKSDKESDAKKMREVAKQNLDLIKRMDEKCADISKAKKIKENQERFKECDDRAVTICGPGKDDKVDKIASEMKDIVGRLGHTPTPEEQKGLDKERDFKIEAALEYGVKCHETYVETCLAQTESISKGDLPISSSDSKRKAKEAGQAN